MSYKVHLERHSSFGYGNFFKECCRDEYNKVLHRRDRWDVIDRELHKFHARIDRSTLSDLIFESEEHFTWFLMRWG